MQPLPPRAAQTADRPRGRGDRERDHQEQRGHAHRDVGPLHDVGAHLAPGEEVVEDEPDAEVQRRVEAREEAQQPAQRDRPGPAQQDPQRGHGQAHQQDAQGPVAQPVGDEADRVGAKVALEGAVAEHAEGRQARRPDHDLQGDAGAGGH